MNSKKVKTFIPLDFRPRVKGDKLEKSSKMESTQEKRALGKRVKAIICLHVKDDSSQARAISDHVDTLHPILFLHYDDLGEKWTFSFFAGELLFYQGDQVIEPLGIYNRSYYPDTAEPEAEIFLNLLQAIDIWKGKKIGASSLNYHNSSKIFQLTSTIRKSIQHTSEIDLRVPRSYFIKGKGELLERILNKEKEMIVKSSSGIRSEVVTNDIFVKWDRANLSHLPTLFQECVRGKDIRVHILDDNCWSVKVDEKDSIDYRYAKKKSPYTRIEINSHLISFCKSLACIENVRLVGIDLIDCGGYYQCLECNPSPGWAGFHRHAKEEHFLVKALIEKLSPEASRA